MACEGSCVRIDEVGQSVDWNYPAELLPASQLAQLTKWAKDENTKYTMYGCPDCHCKGRSHFRITQEYVIVKVTLPDGKETYLTGWVTVGVTETNGECSEKP
jgi:hypothetical protein